MTPSDETAEQATPEMVEHAPEPQPAPVVEQAVAEPEPHVRVRYAGAHHLPSPVEIAGRWWHSRTEHTVPAEHAAELLALAGFHAVAPRRP